MSDLGKSSQPFTSGQFQWPHLGSKKIRTEDYRRSPRLRDIA